MIFPSTHLSQVRDHLRKPLYRNAYALMTSTGATSVLGVLYWVLAARFYPADFIGVNSAAISVMMFLSGVAQLNLMSLMIRYLPIVGRSATQLVVYSYVLTSIVSLVIGVFFVLGVEIWAPSLSFLQEPVLGAWFVLGILAWGIFALQDHVLTGLRRTMWVPIENIVYGVAKIILLLAFAVAFTAQGIFASWTLPAILTVIPVNFLIFRRFLPRHVKTGDRFARLIPVQIFKYLGGNYVAQLFGMASTRLLPLLVINQVGATANAYFFLPLTISYAIRTIIDTMVISLTVEGSTAHNDIDVKSYHFLIHIAKISLPLIALLVICAPLILMIFGPAYAEEGTTLLRLLLLSIVPHMISAVYLGMARVRQNITGVLAVEVGSAVLIVSLSYLFLPLFGITGVGLGILASEILMALALVLVKLQPIRRMVLPRQSQDTNY